MFVVGTERGKCGWHLRELSGVPVAEGCGELTGMPDECRAKLIAAAQASNGVLAVDLGAVRYLQSAALGGFLGVATELHAGGGRLAIICPPGDLARLLSISGAYELDGLLRIFQDVPSAVAWLK